MQPIYHWKHLLEKMGKETEETGGGGASDYSVGLILSERRKDKGVRRGRKVD